MPPVTINWSDLEIAFERNSPDQESFLDLENGDLLAIIEGEPDAAARRAKVANNPGRYLRVDPASSREQYRWMERFVASVSDQALRERLLVAIDGKGAFRRFKDVLLAFPAERERWFTYRSDLLHFHIQTWIEHMQIEVGQPAALGQGRRRPEEPTELPRPIPSGEAPGRDPAPPGPRSARRDPRRRAALGAGVPRVPARPRHRPAAGRGRRQARRAREAKRPTLEALPSDPTTTPVRRALDSETFRRPSPSPALRERAGREGQRPMAVRRLGARRRRSARSSGLRRALDAGGSGGTQIQPSRAATTDTSAGTDQPSRA